jgi:hypothetical protein
MKSFHLLINHTKYARTRFQRFIVNKNKSLSYNSIDEMWELEFNQKKKHHAIIVEPVGSAFNWYKKAKDYWSVLFNII